MNETFLSIIIDRIALGVGIAGVMIVLWGTLLAVIGLIRIEFKHFRRVAICKKRDYLRHHLGQYLLLGLEFLVAADIIHTIFKPDVESLIILGVIVAIRTVISHFLNKELAEAHNCEEEDGKQIDLKQ